MVPHSSKCDSPLLGAQCDSEEQADVVFVVCGAGGERWRVPAHRRVLAAASPVFAAMLQGPMAEPPGREVCVRDVERRAFDLLLRHIYGEAVELQSVDTALGTLYAAHKYQCEVLENQCLDFLSSHIDTSTVLIILHYIRFYCNLLVAPNAAVPSAPSLEAIESGEEVERKCLLNENSTLNNCNSTLSEPTSKKLTGNSKVESTNCDLKVPLECAGNHSKRSLCDNSQNYKRLLQRCLQFIDLKADKVLQQELVDELCKEELLFIVQRDTLCLSSEVVLFKALEQWSKSVCKRNCLELSCINRRNALGNELLFSVRYLLMTSEEFMNNPMKSELLKKDESSYLLGHILKHSEIIKLDHLEELLPALRKERQKPSVTATSRFCSRNYKESSSINKQGETSQVNLKPKKLFKKKNDQCRKEDVRLQERKPNMSDYFFSCIACIFD